MKRLSAVLLLSNHPCTRRAITTAKETAKRAFKLLQIQDNMNKSWINPGFIADEAEKQMILQRPELKCNNHTKRLKSRKFHETSKQSREGARKKAEEEETTG